MEHMFAYPEDGIERRRGPIAAPDLRDDRQFTVAEYADRTKVLGAAVLTAAVLVAAPTENLRVIAAARGPEARARIDGSLARVGMTERADDRVKSYSQGMRQRLGVAVATQLLMNVSSLGAVRDGLLTPALGQLMPVQGTFPVTMATGVAVAVLTGWIVVPAALGAWGTRTQDA